MLEHKTITNKPVKSIKELVRQPLIIAHGLGVDSIAALVKSSKRGIRTNAIYTTSRPSLKGRIYPTARFPGNILGRRCLDGMGTIGSTAAW
jgi:hypothetical protein